MLENRLGVRIISVRGSLSISIKCLRHVTLNSRVERVDRISSVPISFSLGGKTGLVLATTPHLIIVRIFEFSGAIAAYGLGSDQVVGDPLVREPLEDRRMSVSA